MISRYISISLKPLIWIYIVFLVSACRDDCVGTKTVRQESKNVNLVLTSDDFFSRDPNYAIDTGTNTVIRLTEGINCGKESNGLAHWEIILELPEKFDSVEYTDIEILDSLSIVVRMWPGDDNGFYRPQVGYLKLARLDTFVTIDTRLEVEGNDSGHKYIIEYKDR